MTHVNPETWPARIAEFRTEILGLLVTPGKTVMVSDLLMEACRAEGLPLELRDRSTEAPILGGQLEYLLGEALEQLELDGLIRNTGGGGASDWHLIKSLAEHLGWERPGAANSPGHKGRYIGTARLMRLNAEGERPRQPTRWPGVDELCRQANLCLIHGLDVAAAVTARVAVEEAAERALDELGESLDGPASKKEARLFSRLSKSRGFTPLDRSSTLAVASGIRNNGNSAAHDGIVTDHLQLELAIRQLPHVLQSMSNAVSHALAGEDP